jgi:hypothetical protein
VSEAGKEIVQLNFRYTEQEYISAYRFYVFKSKELFARLMVFYVLISAGLVLIFLLSEVAFPFWFMLVACGLVGLSIYQGYFVGLPRRYFRGDPRFRDEYNLTFTDSGIEFRSPTVNSSLAWSLYTGVIENDNFYILVYGVHSLSIFPKRAFRDSQQDTAFRQLLRRHVDHTLKLSARERETSEYLPPPSGPPDWR